MNETILVTGGTGTLGRGLVALLRQDGRDVRVLSRHPGDGRVVGNLTRNIGLDAALAGVDTVIHCATDGRTDVTATAHLIDAATRAGVRHLVYVSIVGVDRHPFPYYRTKLRVEQLVESSGLGWTILRATQFHDLVYGLFHAQRRLPVLFVPAISFQTIATRDVAARLAELAQSPPAGRAEDIGGPEISTSAELAEQYLRSVGKHRRVVQLKLPGRSFAAYANGYHLAPGHRYGTGTFADFLASAAVS